MITPERNIIEINYANEQIHDNILNDIDDICSLFIIDNNNINYVTNDEVQEYYDFLIYKYDELMNIKKAFFIDDRLNRYTIINNSLDKVILNNDIHLTNHILSKDVKSLMKFVELYLIVFENIMKFRNLS